MKHFPILPSKIELISPYKRTQCMTILGDHSLVDGMYIYIFTKVMLNNLYSNFESIQSNMSNESIQSNMSDAV